MKKHIVLYFGSFNPIHIGHQIIGEYVADLKEVDEVWFVVSPNNPLKNAAELAPAADRLNMARLALKNNPRLFSCDIEFSMPIPSYTIDTLRVIEKTFPRKSFSILMGEDQLENFHLWKSWEEILTNYKVFVFPRHPKGNQESSTANTRNYNVIQIPAPRIEISSTFIRENLSSDKSVRYMVSDDVRQYILEKGIY